MGINRICIRTATETNECSGNLDTFEILHMPVEKQEEYYMQIKNMVKKIIEELTQENGKIEIYQVLNKLNLNDVILVEGIPTSPTFCKILLELEKEGYIFYSNGAFYRTRSNLFTRTK